MDILKNEVVRLQTFQGWPVPHIVTPESLARAGFYYLRHRDQTQCAFCRGVIGEWQVGDNPDHEHRRHFPFCHFVQSVIHPRMGHIERQNVSTRVSFDNPNFQELGIVKHQCSQNEGYVTKDSRLRTFSAWPKALKQKPEVLVEAGFYYVGIGDSVSCFSCGGGIKDWEPEDDPWAEHAKWYPKCNYVSLVKGEDFIRKCALGQDAAAQNAGTLNGNENPSCKTKEDEENALANDYRCGKSETTLEAENRALKEAKLCKICMENEVGVVFLPCGHLAVCINCAPNLQECPICRSRIKATVKTYLS